MTAASPEILPPSPVLADWWRALQEWRAQGWWVGQLLLHHVEALVLTSQSRTLPALEGHVLAGISRISDRTVQGLDVHLHIGKQCLLRLLSRLAADGLATADETGLWQVTASGANALATGSYEFAERERCIFHFVAEAMDIGGRPRFLGSGANGCGAPLPAMPNWTFDPEELKSCVQQSEQWKRSSNFPLRIRDILLPEPVSGPAPDDLDQRWHRVVFNRPEHLLVVLALVPGDDAEGTILGFAAQSEGWQLSTREPIFRLTGAARKTLPELEQGPPLDLWRAAWAEWCVLHNLPYEEALLCQFERQGHRLVITAPEELLARLGSADRDLLRGETWLLAGGERIRSAALVEVLART